jgi:hypothetical protein
MLIMLDLFISLLPKYAHERDEFRNWHRTPPFSNPRVAARVGWPRPSRQPYRAGAPSETLEAP